MPKGSALTFGMGLVRVFNRLSHRAGLLAATASLAALGLCGPALAGTIAAAEVSYDSALLSRFNLVTLGDVNVSTNTTVAGRTTDGGNLNVASGLQYGACAQLSGDVCPGNVPTGTPTTYIDSTKQVYGALTVFGNVAATGSYFGAASNSGGTVSVAGSTAGTFYANRNADFRTTGSTSQMTLMDGKTVTTVNGYSGNYGYSTGNTTAPTPYKASASSVFPFGTGSAINAEVKNLSKGIANLPGTPGVSKQTLAQFTGNTAFITAQNDYTVAGKHYGVIETTVSELAGKTGGFGVNNNGQDATFVVVRGDCPSCMLPTLTSYAGQNKIIFDFVDATALRFAGSWTASILAPLATITYMGGTIDGSVIVNAINQSQALLSNNLFAGDLTGLIPEPTSLALFGVGAAAAGLIRRRRARK